MLTTSPLHPWHAQLGSQRDWMWRGWRTRYTYIRAAQGAALAPASPVSDDVPLLFLHGFGAALTQWHSTLQPLSQHHTVYGLDLVGFGASEKAAAPYKVSFWVEQVYDFWRSFIGCPVVLVGHSLGALVALTAAITHPDMVQGLVLITLPAARQDLLPAALEPLVGAVEHLFSTPLLIRPLFQILRRRAVIRRVLRLVYAQPDGVTETLVDSFAQPALDRRAAQSFCRLSQARTHNDFTPPTKTLLAQLQRPTLLLWGQQDRVIPISWGRQLPPLNPKLKLIELPDAGHCPYDECADQVNTIIQDWLTAHIMPLSPVRVPPR